MQKILIVEDDIDIQDILKNHLVKLKIQVSMCLMMPFRICLKLSTGRTHPVTVIQAELD